MDGPIIIRLLLFGLGLASASDYLPNGCPANFSVHRLLRHETDCDKYYSCSNGQRILMTCPSNTLFDFDLQICNHASAVVCDTSQTTNLADTTELANTTTEFVDTTTELADTTTTIEGFLPNGCPSDFSLHLLLPHETDCYKFYSCSNGQKVLFTCPGGTLFDFELQVCNWAQAVTCSFNLALTTFSQEFTTTETATENTSEEPVATSSSESTDVTISSFTTASSTTMLSTEATTEASSLSICPDGFLGSVPHPETCDSYYICTEWDPIQMFCLPGCEYDPMLQTCIQITEGGCTWKQQQNTTTESEISAETTITSWTEETNTKTTVFEPPITPEATITTQEVTMTDEDEETKLEPTTQAQLTTIEASTPEATTVKTEDVTEDLETTTEINPTSPSVCPDGYFGSLPHPELCESYYVCTGWNPIQLFCLPGFEFDSQLQTCVEITEGGCTWNQQQHTTSESGISSESTIISSTEVTNTKTTVFEPPITSEATITTQEVTMTDKDEETTFEPTTQAQLTTTEASTPEATTVETEDVTEDLETTTETNPTSPSVCPDGFFGSLPHPELCESYYVCTGWNPIQLFCLPGFEFDSQLQTCVEITEGGCTWNQQQHTTTESKSTVTDATEDMNTKTTASEFPTMPVIIITTQETPMTDTSEETTFKPTTATQLTTTEATTAEIEDLTSTELNPIIPSICPDGFFGSVPHPEICESYYVCTGWDPIQLFCVPGFEFDLYLQICVEISEGGCTWSQITTTRVADTTISGSSTTDTPETKPSIILPTTIEITTKDESELSTTDVTSELETTIKPTTELLTTDKTTEIDEATKYPVTDNLTTDDPTTVELPTEDWKTTESHPVTPEICPDGYFGSLPHPERCDAYYLCSGWSPILLFCSNGFEFDPVIGTCVVITEGGCTWQQTSTSATTEEQTETTVDTVASDMTVEQSTVNAITEGITQEVITGFSTEDVNTPSPTTVWSTTTTITTDKTANPTTEEWITSEFTKESSTISVETTLDSGFTTSVQTTSDSWVITTEQGPLTTDDLTPSVFTTTGLPDATVELTDATTEFTTTIQPICPDGFFGNIPHTERCDAYYLCTGWNPILLFCSSGFEFDPELGYCVAISEGGCTWSQSSTTTSSPDLSTLQTTTPEMATSSKVTDSDEITATDLTENNTTTTTTDILTTPGLPTDIPVIVTSTDETVDTDTTLEVSTENLTTLELSTDAFTTELVSHETAEPVTTKVTDYITEGTTKILTSSDSTIVELTTEKSVSTTAENTELTEIATDGDKITTESTQGISMETDKITTTEFSTEYSITPSTITTETLDLGSTDDLNGSTDIESSTTEKWGVTIEQSTTSEATESVTPTLCPDGYFGNIPHPERCDAYYLCSGWNPILLFCPSGYEFDSETASCAIIAEEGCTWLKTSTTYITEQTTSIIVDETATAEEASEINTGLWTTETSTLDFTTAQTTTVNSATDVSVSTSTLDYTSDITTDDWNIATATEESIATWHTTNDGEDLITAESYDLTTTTISFTESAPSLTTNILDITTLTEKTDTLSWMTTTDWVSETTIVTAEASSELPEQATIDEETTVTSADPTTQKPTTEAQQNTTIEGDVTTNEINSTPHEITTTETVTTPLSESTTLEPMTELLVTTEDIQTTTPTTCPAGYFGNIPHPERCDAYYLCSGWNPILLFCPSGYEFDSETAACVVISEGGCTWVQTKTTPVTEQTVFTISEVTTESTTEAITSETTIIVSESTITEDNIEYTTNTSTTDEVSEVTSEYLTNFTTEEITTFSGPYTEAVTILDVTSSTTKIDTDQNTSIDDLGGHSTTTTFDFTTNDESTTMKSTHVPTTVDSSVVSSESSTITTQEETTQSELVTPEYTETIPESTSVLTTTEIITTSSESVTTESQLTTTTELEVTTEELGTSTPAICPDGFFGMIANTEECGTYYMCTGWMPILLRCPSGYEFDPYTEVCVEIAEGRCTWLSTSTVQPSTESFLTESAVTESIIIDTTTEETEATETIDEKTIITTTPLITVEVTELTQDTEATTSITVDDAGFAPPNPGIPDIQETSTETVESVTTTTESITTNKVTVTETEKGSTTSDYEIETTADLTTDSGTIGPTTISVTTETTTIAAEATTKTLDDFTTVKYLESTTESEVTAPVICPDGFFGMVASTEECDAYYLCSGWMPIPLRCPSGYEFDSNNQACVEISEGGCLKLGLGRNRFVVNTKSKFKEKMEEKNKLDVEVDADFKPDKVDTDANVKMFREETITGTRDCQPGFYGNVIKTGSYNTFYMCIDGVAMEMVCLLGTEFDAATQKCVPVSQSYRQ